MKRRFSRIGIGKFPVLDRDRFDGELPENLMPEVGQLNTVAGAAKTGCR